MLPALRNVVRMYRHTSEACEEYIPEVIANRKVCE
jgi:hypothetical protein